MCVLSARYVYAALHVATARGEGGAGRQVAAAGCGLRGRGVTLDNCAAAVFESTRQRQQQQHRLPD